MKAIIIFDVDNVVDESQIKEMGKQFKEDGHSVIVTVLPEVELAKLAVAPHITVSPKDDADNAARYLFSRYDGNKSSTIHFVMQAINQPQGFEAADKAIRVLVKHYPSTEVMEHTGFNTEFINIIRELYNMRYGKK